MKQLFAAAALALATVVPATPALAITDGAPDGNGHPQVGLLVFEGYEDGVLLRWRCSGTLLSPTVMVTAGHCTYGTISGRVWFESDVDAGRPGNGYPTGTGAGNTSIAFCNIATHPLFDTAPFVVHDVGMVQLCGAGKSAPDYGMLPSANQLDALKTQRGLKDTSFTAVGYGLQKSFPDAASWKTVANRVRMVATPKLNQINTGFTGDFSLLLSNNANTGGTCFGDSGGPNFLGSTLLIAGVTSFGINGNCAGTGGVFRLDRQNVLDFVNGFIAAPYSN